MGVIDIWNHWPLPGAEATLSSRAILGPILGMVKDGGGSWESEEWMIVRDDGTYIDWCA